MGLQSATIECVGGKRYPHYYLCNYRPKATGSDGLSASLLRFKNGAWADTSAWIDCTVQEIRKIPYLEHTLVLRALHADETMINENKSLSLDILGKKLAAAIHADWCPSLIYKSRETQPLKKMNKKDRIAELNNVYQAKLSEHGVSRVLILDDIVTTGTTACSIIQSLSKVLTDVSFIVYSLAKTDYEAVLNKAVGLKGASYEWEEHWKLQVAEPEATLVEDLKRWILNDGFPDLDL